MQQNGNVTFLRNSGAEITVNLLVLTIKNHGLELKKVFQAFQVNGLDLIQVISSIFSNQFDARYNIVFSNLFW